MNARESILDFVPEMYRELVPEFFRDPVAEERNSTCGNCAMVAPERPLLAAGEYFAKTTKCCTYHPLLPNYCVGGLLLDESPEGADGRRRIRDKIAAGIGVTPLGIAPPGKHRVLYHFGKVQGFGRANVLACPYLDQEQGRCTVWRYRDGVCATWFCKHNNGADGQKFWSQLRDTLLSVQGTLSAHVLRELGFDPDIIATALPAELDLSVEGLDDAPPDPRARERLWGKWVGQEESFYARAHELVAGLDRNALASLGGIRLSLEFDRLEKRYRAVQSPILPDPLVRNPNLRVLRGADGSFLLVGYSGTDVMRVRKPVYEALDYFDGRLSTDAVNDAIFMERGVRLGASLLTKLFQHRILVGAVKDASP